MAEHVHDENCDHDNDDEGVEEALGDALELETQNQLYLQMRQQNIEMLSIAVELAGFGGQHPALKPHEVKAALRTVGEVLSEFYGWVDPDQADEDDPDEEEDDE